MEFRVTIINTVVLRGEQLLFAALIYSFGHTLLCTSYISQMENVCQINS